MALEAQNNPFTSILMVEAVDPDDPGDALPSAGQRRLVVGADHLFYLLDDAGVATLVGGDAAAHIADTSAAHAASSIGFTPNGSIAATDVQAAIQEVRDEAAGGSALTVEEVDTSPTDSAVTKIVFPNGTLGIAANVATYTPISVAQTYTPAWSSDGSAPALGNGTITGDYNILAPGLVAVRINMTLGSTSTVGTGNYRWSLPNIGTYLALDAAGTAAIRDSSTTQRGFGFVQVVGTSPGTVSVRLPSVSINAGDWSATVPVTPANGDSYSLSVLARYT